MKTYLIKEIFGPTIQGEGSYSGQQVYFLRFSGCNKWTGHEKDREKAVCKFCDTDFINGIKMSADEIVSELRNLSNNESSHLVLSGGEPTLQMDEDLLMFLESAGWLLHLETNGSKDISDLEKYFTHITCSPKQSKAETKLKGCNDLKLLYPTQIPGTEPENWDIFNCEKWWLQPVDDSNRVNNTTETIHYILNNPSWRLSLQLHKILGVK